MTYLNRPHCDLTQRSATPRSRLIFVAVVLSTLSYLGSAVRGEIAGSPRVAAAGSIENVTVAMDIDQGPTTYRATGFLHGFSSTSPSDDLVVPLKPKLFRLSATETWNSYPRVKRLGAKLQLVVSDSYSGQLPGYNAYQSTWEATIANLVAKADSLGFTDIEWDLWNEPDYVQFWSANPQQFYDAWEIGYRKLRSLKPGAVIVGPSTTTNIPYIKDFLLFAKAHNVLPDVLAFHMVWGNERNIPYYVSDLRAFMASNGINIPKISLNEYIAFDGSDSFTTSVPNPGRHARLLANLEQAAPESAAKAAWSSGATLGNVAPNNTKTPLWWVYKAYADITGRLVQVVSSQSIDGTAGQDSSTGTARVLLGSYGGVTGDVAVSITGLGQVGYLASGGRTHVLAERITSSTKGSTLPQRVIDADYTVSGGQITVVLPSFASSEAFALTLSAPDTTPLLDPVAVYAFEEGSGSTASDSSGNGNTGTLLNGPIWTTGKIGKAVSLDGVNDSVMVANNSALMPSSSLTLAAWFNANPQQAPFATLIGKTSSGGYWLGIDRDGTDGGVANALCGELAVGGVWKIIHSQAIVYSAWNHVALTYDGSTARLYLNGVQVDSAPLSGTVGDTTQPLCIGMDPNGGTCSDGPFKGIIDEVKIYNRALSAAEVSALASPGTSDTTPPTVSLAVPASGATVSGTAVTVSANATDNVAVAGVQFTLDGVNLGSEDTASPYSITWNSTSAANGSHTLSAVARDSSANKATAASVTVNVSNGLVVPDTTPPQVSITSPLNGASVQKDHNLNIKAPATDNIKVSKVEFYVDGVLKGTDTVPDSHNVYKYTWRVPAPIGVTYRLQVIAYDTSNNSSSGVISVTSR